MKIIFIFIAALLIFSCKTGDSMNKINDLCLKVTSSVNATDEEHALEKLWEHVSDNRIFVEIFSIDESGNKIDVNDIDEVQIINKVHVIFSKEKRTKVLEWKPIDIENVFILFREK